MRLLHNNDYAHITGGAAGNEEGKKAFYTAKLIREKKELDASIQQMKKNFCMEAVIELGFAGVSSTPELKECDAILGKGTQTRPTLYNNHAEL